MTTIFYDYLALNMLFVITWHKFVITWHTTMPFCDYLALAVLQTPTITGLNKPNFPLSTF